MSAKNLRQEINEDDLDLETIAKMVIMLSQSLPRMLKEQWSTKMAELMAIIDVIAQIVEDLEAPARTEMETQDDEVNRARKLGDLPKALEEAQTVQPMLPMLGTEAVSEKVVNTILKAFSFQQ